MSISKRSFGLAYSLIAIVSTSLFAQSDTTPVAETPSVILEASAADDAKQPMKASEGLLHEAEATVLPFVEEHHSQLLSVLTALKQSNPKEYEAAIADILKTLRRLSQLEKRNKTLYDVDLDAWKTQSRIDLMMARAIAKEHSLDEAALRSLVAQRRAIQVKRLKVELEQLDDRKKQLQDSLVRLEDNEKERMDQQVLGMLKRIDSKKPKKKSNDSTKVEGASK
jgi:hypothetical protein